MIINIGKEMSSLKRCDIFVFIFCRHCQAMVRLWMVNGGSSFSFWIQSLNAACHLTFLIHIQTQKCAHFISPPIGREKKKFLNFSAIPSIVYLKQFDLKSRILKIWKQWTELQNWKEKKNNNLVKKKRKQRKIYFLKDFHFLGENLWRHNYKQKT